MLRLMPHASFHSVSDNTLYHPPTRPRRPIPQMTVADLSSQLIVHVSLRSPTWVFGSSAESYNYRTRWLLIATTVELQWLIMPVTRRL